MYNKLLSGYQPLTELKPNITEGWCDIDPDQRQPAEVCAVTAISHGRLPENSSLHSVALKA
jgi:hypothetical protein